MRNFKLKIEYAGTHYYGWQVQNRKSKTEDGKRNTEDGWRTIQAVIEKTLQKILQEKIKLIVAGRTDSGVHALGQVANFKSLSRISLEKLHWALNCLLPEDIKVARIKNVGLDFNSRFSAKSKLYRYTILNRKYSSALLANRVYFFNHILDVRLMRREAKVLLGRHNFTSFQAMDSRTHNPYRVIKQIKISKEKDFLHIDIQADSFLYNMVRSIAGTLLEIGRGKFPKGSMEKVLKARNHQLAGPTLPAKGLYLVKVRY